MNRILRWIATAFVQLMYSALLYAMGFCFASTLVMWTVIVCQQLGMDVSGLRLLRCCLAGAVPLWLALEVRVWLGVANNMRRERLKRERAAKSRLVLNTEAPAEDEEADRSEREILAEEALFDGDDEEGAN